MRQIGYEGVVSQPKNETVLTQMTTAVTGQYSTIGAALPGLVSAVLPIAGAVLAARIGWKFFRGFVK